SQVHPQQYVCPDIHYLTCTIIFFGGAISSSNPRVSTFLATSVILLLNIKSAFSDLYSQLNSFTSLLILSFSRIFLTAMWLLAIYIIPNTNKKIKYGSISVAASFDTAPSTNSFLKNIVALPSFAGSFNFGSSCCSISSSW